MADPQQPHHGLGAVIAQRICHIRIDKWHAVCADPRECAAGNDRVAGHHDPLYRSSYRRHTRLGSPHDLF